MKIIGLNGIWSRGERSVALMLEDLVEQGFDTYHYQFPVVNPVTANWRHVQQRNAAGLAAIADPGDAVVAHSYGCLVTLRAMEQGAMFGPVFFFGAAMNDDFTFPVLGMEALVNTWNPFDTALGLGAWLPWHDFGDLGRTGYRGQIGRAACRERG